MNQEIHPGPWEPYSDEAAHYSYVRCLEQDSLYEVVRISHEKGGRTAEFLHQVIFMKEYGEAELSKILVGFGYDSLEAFARETGSAGTAPMRKARRSGDCAAEAQLPIDYMTLACLMAEHFTGRNLPVQTADAFADHIVHKAADAVISPCRIKQTIEDQRTTIPLAEEGVNEAYVVTVIRQRFEGRNVELYQSSYRIDRDRLPNPSGGACETYLRKIVSDFLQTEDGKRAYESTCRDFNWGDVETEISSGFFSSYGVVPYGGGPDDGEAEP